MKKTILLQFKRLAHGAKMPKGEIKMYGIMRVEKRGRADVYGIQLEANRTVEQHEKGLDFDK